MHSAAQAVDQARSGRGPMVPNIATCEPRARAVVTAAYEQAYRWAAAAHRWLVSFASGGSLRRKWNSSAAIRLFGPFRADRVRRIFRVFDSLVRRFIAGYEIRGQRVAPTITCFSSSYHRCGKGLLGNASIYGTIRLCPQLLRRPVRQVASIVLHELMHQALGVGDRRHETCEGSKHRCYREGALDLVSAGRFDLATRNIDNYVAFARHVAGAPTTSG